MQVHTRKDTDSFYQKDLTQDNQLLNQNISEEKEEFFEYSKEDSNVKETDKKISFQTNFNKQNSILEKSVLNSESTLKLQQSIDSMLPINKLLKGVNIQNPNSFYIENESEEQVISFNLKNLNEVEYEKLLLFMLKYHQIKNPKKHFKKNYQNSPKSSKDNKSNLNNFETDLGFNFKKTNKIENVRNELLSNIQNLNHYIESMDRMVINLKDNHRLEIEKCNRQIRFLTCLLYTSPSPRDGLLSRMPSSA